MPPKKGKEVGNKYNNPKSTYEWNPKTSSPEVSRGTRTIGMKVSPPLEYKYQQLTHFHIIEGFAYQGFLKLLFLNDTIQLIHLVKRTPKTTPTSDSKQKKKIIPIILMPFLLKLGLEH